MKSSHPFLAATALCLVSSACGEVTLEKAPENGLQPKALVDASGVTHLITYRGEAGGGDLFYATRPAAGTGFTKPKRINTVAHSAVSAGTIRGGQFALGKDGLVHVVWNGSRAKKGEEPPLFYTRSKAGGDGFEDQRAMSGDWVMDGGGAVAADTAGNVYVFYHGGKGAGEASRRVLVRVSHDSGASFDQEIIISPDDLGVCGCCAMQAFADAKGRVFVVYRTASDGGKSRDIATMFSSDHGKTWRHEIASRWAIAACPMSSMTIAQAGAKVLMGWEKEGQIFVGTWDDEAGKLGSIAPMPGPAAGRKHPVITSDSAGGVLVAWTEGTGWNRGGGVAWQLLDQSLRPAGEGGRREGVPVWSFVSAVPTRGRGFTILH